MNVAVMWVWWALQIFKVAREGEAKVYKPFRDLHNRMLLWHGSRTTNFAGILSQGLRIAPPEAPVVSLGMFFPEMTYTVSGGTLNPTHSLT